MYYGPTTLCLAFIQQYFAFKRPKDLMMNLQKKWDFFFPALKYILEQTMNENNSNTRDAG